MAYRVVDSEFNRQNYPHLIGKLFDSPPSYVAVEVVTPEDTVGARVLKTLVTRSINDITMEQMNRIVRRLSRMPTSERGIPKRVAEVVAEEIGIPAALQYIDKALAAGQIKMKEWEEMRATLIFVSPREAPAPEVAQAVRELLAGQQRLKQDFGRLTGTGKEVLRKPVDALTEDVKRIRKAWGV